MQTPAFAPSVQTISPHTIGRRSRQPVVVTVQAVPGYDASFSTSQSFVNRSVMHQSNMSSQSLGTSTGPRRRAVPLRSPFRRAGANTSADGVTTAGESLKRGRGTSPSSLFGAEQYRPRKQRVHSLVDTPKASSADGLTSDTAKRILNAINKVSSPLSDASRLAKFQPSRPGSADPSQRSVSLSGTPRGRIPRTGLPSSVKRDPFRYTPRAKRGAPPVDSAESTPASATRKSNPVSNSTGLKASKKTKATPTTTPFTSASEAKANPVVATKPVANGSFKLSTGTKLLEKTSPAAAKPAMGGFSAFAGKKPAGSPSAGKPSPSIDAKPAPSKALELTSDASKLPAAKPVPGFSFASSTPRLTPEQSKPPATTASFSFASATPVEITDGAGKLPASFKKAASSQESSPAAGTSTPTAVKATSTLKKPSAFDFSPAKKLDVSKAAAEASPTVGSTSFSFAKASPIGASAVAASLDAEVKKAHTSSASPSGDASKKKEPAIPSARAIIGANDMGSSSPLAAAVSATDSKPKSALPFATKSTLSTGSTADVMPKVAVWGTKLVETDSDAAKSPLAAFSFGSKTATPAAAAAAKPAATFSFGGATPIDAKKEAPAADAVAAAAKPAPSFSFGGATPIDAKKEAPAADAVAAAAKPAPSFSFGGATPIDAKKEVPAADTAAADTAAAAVKPAPSFSFGGVTPAEAKTDALAADVAKFAAAFSFGAAKVDTGALLVDPSVSPFGTKKVDASKPAFSFGGTAAPPAAAAPAASAAAALPIKFGFSDSLEKSRSPFGTPTPGPVGLAKAEDSMPDRSESGPRMMSGDSDTAVPAAAAPAGGFRFGGASASPALPVSTSFGAAPAAAAAGPSGFTFAATSAAAPAATTGGFSFGASTGAVTAPASASGGDGFQFGAGAGTPAAATPAAASNWFQFGASAGTPAAGTTPAAAPGGFQFGASVGTPVAAPTAASGSGGGGGFQFGGTPAAASAAPFGGAAPATNFGTASPAPSTSFGAAPSAGFGAGSASTSFGGGAPAPTAAAGFGGGGGAGFSFGGTNASAAPATTGGGGFQFGGATPAAGGFGAPAQAAGGFGAPAAGGFGAGASAPAAGGFGAGASSFGASSGGSSFNAGAGAGSSFGAPAPSAGGFGAPAPSAGGFNAGASGFNPGTSNTSGRKIIKARRRAKKP